MVIYITQTPGYFCSFPFFPREALMSAKQHSNCPNMAPLGDWHE